MIEVHHLEKSRSQRISWLLEELGLDYELVRYKRDPETKLAPTALKKVHPLGKSPVITENGLTIAESGAIVEYLLEAHGEGRFRPGTAAPQAERLAYRFWLHHAEGSAMPPLLMKLFFEQMKRQKLPLGVKQIAGAIASKVLKSYINPNVTANMDFWEETLSASAWFAGTELTGADFLMSFPVEASLARHENPGRYPGLSAFLERVQARPAWARALERAGDYGILGSDN